MKYPKQPQPVKAGWRILLLLAMTMFTFGPAGITPVHAVNCYDLVIVSNPAVGGTVNVNPLPNCGGKYTEGTPVTLTAVPNSKYNLKNWSGDATGSTNPVVVAVDGNKSVTARFVPKNDDYDLATQILGLTYSDTLNTTEALAAFEDDPLDPNPVGPCLDGDTFFAGHKTLWYHYRPLVNESIQVDTLGSREIINSNQDLDTYVAVWKLVQENPRVLELVDCNDDDPTFAGSVTSRLTLVALANTTYYFQVAQYNGVPGDELTRKSPKAANIKFNVNITNIDVTIGSDSMGRYYLGSGEELREYYDKSGGPVKVEGVTGMEIVTAIRLQSFANNTLYSFVETMGVPEGLLSHKYYFPTYNNTWTPLNSQVRFGNLDAAQTRIRVTIGGVNVWEEDVPGLEERRLYFDVSGGPVVIESLDPTKKIVAAIRLQSMDPLSGTLYSFSETMGIPDQSLSHVYYFPTYNNTWAPLNSQIRFANLSATQTRIRVTIGGANVWEQDVPALGERRLYFDVSGGPVKVESLDTSKKIVAAIRLQSLVGNTLYSFVETMGVPGGLLSYKYYFPTYNNTWAPLNSQVRFGNLEMTTTRIRVTIGGVNVWEQDVPALGERRLYFDISGGPVVIESLDPTKKIVAAIRLQSLEPFSNTLYSFSETMGIPDEKMSETYFFPTYNNTWTPLNSQLRFGVP